MKEKLSEAQQRVYDYLKEQIVDIGHTPTVREIGAATGFKSPSSVQYNLNALEKAGYITRTPELKRTIQIVGVQHAKSVPLVGTVAAGEPIFASENIEGYIPVPLHDGGKYFALRVKGNSMINAHICSGDIIVVKQTSTADNGQIVVALVDDEATVKRFYKEKGHYRLQPENNDFSPIIVKKVTILGRVAVVIRDIL